VSTRHARGVLRSLSSWLALLLLRVVAHADRERLFDALEALRPLL
jgi:hypothetical protein